LRIDFVLECGGRAKRRHRFSKRRDEQKTKTFIAKSGVALRFPPQSKNTCGRNLLLKSDNK
jgi:hypothetical protein